MFNRPSLRAGLLLAAVSATFSAAASACPLPADYQEVLLDGSAGQNVLKNAIAYGTVIKLTGQFNITQPIAINHDCVIITSASASAPAVLYWNTELPVPTQPARVFIHPHDENLPRHHLEIRNLNFRNAGVHLLGSNHTVAGNTFSQGHADVSVYKGSGITVERNTFSNVSGVSAWVLHQSKIDSNTFTHVVQPISIRSEGNNNTVTNNIATGTVQFGIEFLGIGSEQPGINRFVNNVITNNSFTAPSKPTPGDHGAYGGISVVAGTNNLISNNTVDCGLVCRAADTIENVKKKLSYSQKGDLIGFGIEIADAKSRVIGNTIKGFNTGIFISNPQSDVSTSNDVATLDGNRIYTSNQAIAINCYPNAANGVEPARADIGRCRRAYVIQNNLIQEARDVGISGASYFYYPSTNTDTQSSRYVMNMASESTAITIHNNTITRSYGAFPGDATVTRPNRRYTGIAVGPILNPTQQRVTSNNISLKGAPPAGSEFGFIGIELMPYTLLDTKPPSNVAPCTKLPNGTSLAGLVIQGNTVTHSATPFGRGIASICGMSDGVSIQSNTFNNLSLTLDLQ